MAFVSDLEGCPIIDDDTQIDMPNNESTGYELRPFDQQPYGSVQYTRPFDIPLIPRSEWADRVQHIEETKSRVTDLRKHHKLPVLDQNGTNYCWINGVVNAMHVARARMNLPFISLSPASGGARIKNFRNVGGWGAQAVEFISENGVCQTKYWPANAISRQYLTDEAKEDAKKNRIEEWYELRPRNLDQLATMLLLGYSCSVAYNWWRHLVCADDLVVVESGSYGIRISNSWGKDWKQNGTAIFREGKGTPDEQFAIRVVLPRN